MSGDCATCSGPQDQHRGPNGECWGSPTHDTVYDTEAARVFGSCSCKRYVSKLSAEQPQGMIGRSAVASARDCHDPAADLKDLLGAIENCYTTGSLDTARDSAAFLLDKVRDLRRYYP